MRKRGRHARLPLRLHPLLLLLLFLLLGVLLTLQLLRILLRKHFGRPQINRRLQLLQMTSLLQLRLTVPVLHLLSIC